MKNARRSILDILQVAVTVPAKVAADVITGNLLLLLSDKMRKIPQASEKTFHLDEIDMYY